MKGWRERGWQVLGSAAASPESAAAPSASSWSAGELPRFISPLELELDPELLLLLKSSGAQATEMLP